jgi:hypothetical protein
MSVIHSVSEYKKRWFFPVLNCFLNFLFFHYSSFLALQGRFLNFSRFSPWFLEFSKKYKKSFSLLHLLIHISCYNFSHISNTTILTFWLNGPWPLHCNQLCETGNIQMIIFLLFLNLNILTTAFLNSLDIDKFVS